MEYSLYLNERYNKGIEIAVGTERKEPLSACECA